MMRKTLMALAAAVLVPVGAMAEPVDGKVAKKMLFSPRSVDLEVLPDNGLNAAQQAILMAILDGLKSGGLASYYGAVAVSPDFFEMMALDPGQATLSGLIQVTGNLHSPDAAAAVAMQACTKARKSGNADCVLVARILPRKWKPQDVSLSVDATQAFKAYRKGNGPKALATSLNTVAYAVVKAENAPALALARCNALAADTGSPDCEVVIAE